MLMCDHDGLGWEDIALAGAWLRKSTKKRWSVNG
jgi:hypothetical protein